MNVAINKARRWQRRTATGAACLTAAAVAWWAASATLESEPRVESSPEAVTVAVATQTLGKYATYNVTVSQPLELLASNSLAGVVTAASVGETSAMGDELFQVSGISVTAAEGTVPFYRDLAKGDRGADVSQLQGLLKAQGFFKGAVDGDFGPKTETAVKAWQRKRAVDDNGVVRLGELIAVPALPARLHLSDEIIKGVILSGGEPAILGRVNEPDFAILLDAEQASRVPLGAGVQISFGEHTWPALVVESEAEETGSTRLRLGTPDGSPICADACNELPMEETSALTGRVELVPSMTGPSVPAAALRVSASGTTYVTLASGETVDVLVLASGDGLAIVDGVSAGQRVVLPE